MGSKEQGADVTQDRWTVIPRTLCFVTHGDDVLLMKRAAHRRIFPNCYNGLGGHIERNETPMEGAIREIKEEAGIDATNVMLCGIHMIDTGLAGGILLFTYRAQALSREVLQATDEGVLHWINREDVLSLTLVEDLPHILPRVLSMSDADKPYYVHVSYDTNDQIQLKFNN